VASLKDGDLEFVLHRHATGGNGRGPTDDDSSSARGTVSILPAPSRTTFKSGRGLRPVLALRRAHPPVVLYGLRSPHNRLPLMPASWSPLTQALPQSIHLFSLQRRAFLQGGGATPDYPRGSRSQGALRLQHIHQSARQECDPADNAWVELSTLFRKEVLRLDLGLEERTLSMARRPYEVNRRSWRGVGLTGKVVTPSGWRYASSNSTDVMLLPTQIRAFAFQFSEANMYV